jgi:hypothetical protein
VEGKLRCRNFRRVPDGRRAFWLAFGVTGIPEDRYRSTMGVIVRSLRTLQCARENFGCTWEYLGAPVTSLGAPMTSQGAQTTSLGAPVSANEESESADDNLVSSKCTSVWKAHKNLPDTPVDHTGAPK